MSTDKAQTKILVFDNYDSFTYNLVHYIKGLGYKNLEVYRNDQIPLADIAAYDKILLSPGPGIPSEAGILHEVIRTYAPTKSIFGVCLGLQAIGEVFGGTLINLDKVYHGIATDIQVTVPSDLTFEGLPANFKAGRYHSWAVATKDFPSDLEITAVDEKSQIMALRHKTYDVRGVQFHPESILTEHGEQMVLNWLKH
jgi:anthranilate synthase component 2